MSRFTASIDMSRRVHSGMRPMIKLKALLIFGLAWLLLHLAVAVVRFTRLLYRRRLISAREAEYFFGTAKSLERRADRISLFERGQ